jgi:DNA-binding PadR family transcriptional regulator
MSDKHRDSLSGIEFQALLALAAGPSYGYAIMKTVEQQSGGRTRPEIGSLYRLLSRLTARGLVEEQPAPADTPTNHRGHPRRYYGLTPVGSKIAEEEATHLAGLVATARNRDLLPNG